MVWAALSAFPGRLLRAQSRRRPPSARLAPQVGQGNAGPLGVADGTKFPLSPIGLGYEKDPAVPAHSSVATLVSEGIWRNSSYYVGK